MTVRSQVSVHQQGPTVVTDSHIHVAGHLIKCGRKKKILYSIILILSSFSMFDTIEEIEELITKRNTKVSKEISSKQMDYRAPKPLTFHAMYRLTNGTIPMNLNK